MVEDDADIRSLLVDTLLEMGFLTIEAGDGGTGLQQALTEGPDIVLLDLMMPVMDGFQVLETLKDNPATRWIPVIMVSAKGQKADVENALRAGASGYVIKPWYPEELEALITRVLERKFPTVGGPILDNLAAA